MRKCKETTLYSRMDAKITLYECKNSTTILYNDVEKEIDISFLHDLKLIDVFEKRHGVIYTYGSGDIIASFIADDKLYKSLLTHIKGITSSNDFFTILDWIITINRKLRRR